LAGKVLKLLGVSQIRLMTNNPEKVEAMESAGITVTERVSAEVEIQDSFAGYLRTKHEKMGHILDFAENI
jgi:GTP cyclohydrolase II